MRKITIAVAALVLIVGVFAFWRYPETVDPPMPRNTVATPGSDGKLAASAVLKIDLATRSAPAPVARSVLPPASPFTQAYLDRKDWPGLYRRLRDAPATPETQYLQAELLANCAKRAPAAGKPAPNAESRDERRAKFFAGLAANDPQLEKRKAAWERLSVDRCGELAQMEYNADEAGKLVDAAGAGGDPRAKARLLSKQILDDREEASRKSSVDGGPLGTSGYVITDAQFGTMRELLASQDPLVINELRNFLSSTIDGGSIRIGPNQIAVDYPAMYNALALVACDFGAPCGPDSMTILAECATQGRCDAGNLYDHTLYYGVSPHGAQLVEQYRQWLGLMIGARDIGQLNLVRGPNAPGGSHMYGGRRRL